MPSCNVVNDATWSLYVIRDPRDGKVVYVGISKTPRVRFSNHKSASYSPINNMVAQLSKLGMSPQFHVVLSGLTEQQARRVEMRLCFLHTQCSRHRFLGCPVDVVRSDTRTCAIGPKHYKRKWLRVFCNGCGEEATISWTGNFYKGPWIVRGEDVHICKKCRSAYLKNPDLFSVESVRVQALLQEKQLTPT